MVLQENQNPQNTNNKALILGVTIYLYFFFKTQVS